MSALQTIYQWFLQGIGFAAGWAIMQWVASLLSHFFARLAG